MDNGFIKDMEILINCKKIVEALVEENKFLLSQMDKKGAELTYSSYDVIQKRVAIYQGVLNGKNLVPKAKGFANETNERNLSDNVCGLIIKVTKDKYYYRCSKCGEQYSVPRKSLGCSYGEEYKYFKNYCCRCGRKIVYTEHEE